MTLSPKLGVVGISTLWHLRLPLPIQMFIKVASSPRLSGIGMPSPILWSHPLRMQRIVLLSLLLWWKLGTNSLITGPGEWLSFWHFTSKLSWSWSWSSGTRCLIFCQTLRLLLYFMCANSEGSGLLRVCAGSPEPSLDAYVISTIISWACSFLFLFW